MHQLVVSLKGRPVGRFSLEGASVRIGRSPDNEVQLDSLAVSRHHAVLEQVPGGYTVRDLGSNNGTYVNGAPIEGTHAVKAGDLIQVGSFDINVTGDGPAAPKPVKLSSNDRWELAPVNLRSSGEDHEARERAATIRAFLVLNNAPGPPRLIEKDLYQVGKDAACDLRLEGIFAPRKLALIVRGHGGWKLVNVSPDGKRVERNGTPVPDQAWISDGDRLMLGDLEVAFHEGLPTGNQGTIAAPRVRP